MLNSQKSEVYNEIIQLIHRFYNNPQPCLTLKALSQLAHEHMQLKKILQSECFCIRWIRCSGCMKSPKKSGHAHDVDVTECDPIYCNAMHWH